MAVLSDDHRKQLREILEQHAELGSHLQRQFFLEDAGLRLLESQLDMNAKTRLFCFDLVSRCEQAGTHPKLSDDALLLLLRYVRNEVVAGHNDKVMQIDDMLVSKNHRLISSVPANTISPIGTTYSEVDNLWQEFIDAQEDKDWDSVISIGEKLRQNSYKIRASRDILASAYIIRGTNAYNRDLFKKAIDDFSRAIELNPEDIQGYDYRALCYQKAAVLKQSIGSYTKAIEDYSKAISLDPWEHSFYAERGVCYYNKSLLPSNKAEFDKAITDFSKAIDLDPRKARYYNLRSLVYHTAAFYDHPTGNFARAIEDNCKAIEIEPENAGHYHSRGVSYHEAAYKNHPAGDFAKAIEDKSRAIQLEPTNGFYYHSRGKTYQIMWNPQAAQADFDKAKELGYRG